MRMNRAMVDIKHNKRMISLVEISYLHLIIRIFRHLSSYKLKSGLHFLYSPSLLSNLIWQICSETRPIKNTRIDVVNKSALMFVNRPQVI